MKNTSPDSNSMIRLALLAAAMIAIAPGIASAEGIAYDSPSLFSNQIFGGNLGESFQVNQSIVINDIGVYDGNSAANLLASGGTSDLAHRTSIEVAIFDVNTSSNTPTISQVTQTYTFTAGNIYNMSPAGGYVLQPLSGPDAGLVLDASTTDTYWIVAQGFNENDQAGNASQEAGAPAILDASGALTFLAPTAYDLSGPLEVPQTPDFAYPNGMDNQYEAGTFDFTAAPEPGSMLLLGSALLGLFARRRKQ